MKTKTIVYIGSKPFYNLNSPGNYHFIKGDAITIPEPLLSNLPYGDFEEYNSKKHKKPDGLNPILVRLPNGLTDNLAAIPSLYRIRELYPFHKLVLLGKDDYSVFYKGLKDWEQIEYYDVKPGQWFKQYTCFETEYSPAFGGAALRAGTRESCYLLHLGIFNEDERKKPTLLKYKNKPKYITILNTGATMGSVWTEIGDFLSEKEWEWPVQIIDNNDFDNLKKLSESVYVISTGDTELAYLTAYLGIPLFAFVPNKQADYTHQLWFFNNVKENSVHYSEFAPNVKMENIYKGLLSYINYVLKGEPLPEQSPPREKVSLEEEKLGRTG